MNTSDQYRHGAPVDHSSAVAAESARLLVVIEHADLAAPVPSCPGWTLTDLVRHTGTVQRWFTALLRQQVQERPLTRDVELNLPAQADGYPDWLAAGTAEAAAAFTTLDLDAPMWAWGADQHVRFWIRRMLFETLVHRVDTELALGLTPAIDHTLAADGVDEFLTNLPFATPFAPKVANLRGDGETIRFTSTDGDGDGDGDGDWLIRLRPDGFGLDRDGADAAADVTVRGAAADLLLFLYGRLDSEAEAFELTGDEKLLARWVANSEF